MFEATPGRFAAAVVVLLASSTLFLGRHGVSAQPAQLPGAPGGPSRFIEVGQCYRFVFPIPGAPDYKVRRLLDAGWIETEVDAGPASSDREAVYINTAMVVTARSRRCSG